MNFLVLSTKARTKNTSESKVCLFHVHYSKRKIVVGDSISRVKKNNVNFYWDPLTSWDWGEEKFEYQGNIPNGSLQVDKSIVIHIFSANELLFQILHYFHSYIPLQDICIERLKIL